MILGLQESSERLRLCVWDMPNSFTAQEVIDLPQVISVPRFGTYLAAKGGDVREALALYRWNLQISAAFFVPLQVCEVAVRNGVSESIEDSYGLRWPWSAGFIRSIPSHGGYNPSSELVSCARRHITTGKVIADLKFAFWQKMFISIHKKRIWDKSLFKRFPNCSHPTTVAMSIISIHNFLEDIRQLRNRIAHHEPIFMRDLTLDYEIIQMITRYRNEVAANWVHNNQFVTSMIASKP